MRSSFCKTRLLPGLAAARLPVASGVELRGATRRAPRVGRLITGKKTVDFKKYRISR